MTESSYPSVTVVIPTYDRNDLLETALQSVADQGYNGPVDAVVVDDNPDREAKPVVESFPCTTYCWKPAHFTRQDSGHENAATARDLGNALAEGEYIHFLDDDDWLRPEAISQKITAIKNDPDADAAYSAIEKTNGEVKHVPDVVIGNELAFTLMKLRPPTLPSATLVRRDVLMDCPPNRTLPHEDICGLIEILFRTTIVYVDEPLTVRGQEPTGGQSIRSQRGRLWTHERYAGLRKQLLPEQYQTEAEQNYEELKQRIEESEQTDGEPTFQDI